MSNVTSVSLSAQHVAWLESQKIKGNKQNLSHILRNAIQQLIDQENGIVEGKAEMREELELTKHKVEYLAKKLATAHKVLSELDDETKASVYASWEKLSNTSTSEVSSF